MCRYYSSLFLVFAAIISFCSSCNKYEESAIPQETEWIMFSTGDGIEGSGYVETRTMENEITCDITDWEEDDSNETRAGIVETLYDSVGVFGYNYEHWSSSELPGVMCNTKNVLNGDKLAPETKVLWKNFTKDSLRFYAYAPFRISKNVSTAAEGGVPYLKYTVPSSVTTQMDILYAQSEAVPATNRNAVPLEFKHAMTAVKFRLGETSDTLKQVVLLNIKHQGTLSLDGTWSDLSSPQNDTITKTSEVMLLLPQTLSSDATIKLRYKDSLNNEHNITASLDGQVWPAGKRVVYTLKKKPEPGTVEHVYFDFTAGDIILTDSKYSGYVYVTNTDSTAVAVPVTGEPTNSTKYYIYQSAPDSLVKADGISNENIKSSKTGYASSAEIGHKIPTLPQYSTVKVGGKTWGEYITDNTKPDEVLATWNSFPENFLEPGTPHRILICGNARFDITLDRVYSRYFPYRAKWGATGDDKYFAGVECTAPVKPKTIGKESYKETYGGITIGIDSLGCQDQRWDSIPGKIGVYKQFNEQVFLRLKGDNYFSRINYNKPSNVGDGFLKITSEKGADVAEGTLTVTLPKLRANHPEYEGLLNFTRGGLIGAGNVSGNFRGASLCYRQVSNIFFQGGIVYIGIEEINNSVWPTNDNMMCAIGGINAASNITISGGILTSVSYGSSPAIGGGAGWLNNGGNGYVTITGGTVYAHSFGVYNAEEEIDAPVLSTAIGGGSSGNDEGNPGTVTIRGGTVYAYSLGGCAIGGGTSAKLKGGKGTVTISGGRVYAKSISGKMGAYDIDAGVSIGGGRAGTADSVYNSSKKIWEKPFNGGDAKVTISGGTIVAGSVGGGKCGNSTGKLGLADVSVSGGETSAQFLLVKDKSVETANKFTMKAGVIKNSSTSDTEYTKVKPEGGAVYMESGSCTIRGGTISNCSATNGGAVYMNGGTFRMVKGTIRDCKGLTNGGGVYIEGGNVEIDSTGTISHNMAASGNGGGVFIEGGNFTMKGGSVTNNTSNHNIATGLEGNGGGIYVASDTSNVKVTITGGTIKGNLADRSGAGLRVDMTGAAKGITANIVIGTPGGVASTPDISSNTASFTGGGMSVAGIGSKITIYSGTVKGNVSSIVTNEEIENDGGIVDLVGKNTPGQPQQVNVNYKTIYFYANNGDDPEPFDEQRVITSTNSPLKPTATALSFKKEFYYLDSWNTKRDGSGVTYAKEGGEDYKMNITSDLVLYGQWVRYQ